MRMHLKRHNHVYILSSKHTYRPMRARVVAQLFYKVECKVSAQDEQNNNGTSVKYYNPVMSG